ncbi:unnamed protein product [Candida verbasci]|uniref:Transcription factor TBF1 n=1 Tax=Candida verbasci TaxID=1227364 RepID=A0A9W4TRN3_9ASCO|nr:unnamed protein product [Candida verbasci]
MSNNQDNNSNDNNIPNKHHDHTEDAIINQLQHHQELTNDSNENNEDIHQSNLAEINKLFDNTIDDQSNNIQDTTTSNKRSINQVEPENDGQEKRQKNDTAVEDDLSIDPALQLQQAQPNDTNTEVRSETKPVEELKEKAIAQDEEKEAETRPETRRSYSSAIPPDSELLNTNTAYAAYTTLSSQLNSSHFSVTGPQISMLQSANLTALPSQIVAAEYLPARIQLLVNTLPTLDNLATQLLRIVAGNPYTKIIDLASNTDTPSGATYRDLTSLFEFTKRLYSEEDPFLTVDHIAPGMWRQGETTPQIFKSKEQSIESTLRKVNLASFLAATLGTIEIGFFYLNESFLDIFCPSNNLDPTNALSNVRSFEGATMATQVPSGGGNAIGEKVGKLLKAQAMLFLDLKTQAYISAVDAGERSREEILEDILPDNLDGILLNKRNATQLTPVEIDFVERCKSRKQKLLNYNSTKPLSEEFEWFHFLRELFDYSAKNMGYLIWGKISKSLNKRHDYNTTDSLLNSYDRSTTPQTTTSNDNEEVTDISQLLPSEIQERQVIINGQKPSQRRPWTKEEEKALRHALELKGPHWSTILELFGQGGKINESLKNRTQVQLKDKARNWKVFFLKHGQEVPAYLKGVTGQIDEKNRRSGARTKRNNLAPVKPIAVQSQQLNEHREKEKQEQQNQQQ